MKLIKMICIVGLLSLSAFRAHAQDYGTLMYWGKEYKLDRKFISVLNENWSLFIYNTAPTLRYYDAADYQDIYSKIVANLTSQSFTIIVTEANQLKWRNANGILPGTDGETDRSKKSYKRATLVLYEVVLPALNQFMQYKEAKLD